MKNVPLITALIVCDWDVEWETISPAVAKRFSEVAPKMVVQIPTDVALTEYAGRILQCNRVLQPAMSLRKLRVSVTDTPMDLIEPDMLRRFFTTSARHSFDELISLAKPILLELSDFCRAEIRAHQNVARRWSSLATLQLLAGEPFFALESLSQLMTLSRDELMREESASSLGAVEQALRVVNHTLKSLDSVRSKLPGFVWLERLSALAMVVVLRDVASSNAVKELTSWGSGPPQITSKDAVLILSGGSRPGREPMVEDALRPELLRAVEGLPTVVIGSGITQGSGGLAGDIAEHLRGQIRAHGYLPRFLPMNFAEDSRYDSLQVSEEDSFTPMFPLQMWTDLVAAGVDLGRVRMLTFGGGRLARLEAAMACGFGALVGIVAGRGIAPPEWATDLAYPVTWRFALIAPEASSLRTFLSASAKP